MMRMVVASLALLCASAAAAQSTGGSFESSDWSSGGSSGGSSSDWSSGSSSDWSSGSSESAPAEPPSAATFRTPSRTLGDSYLGLGPVTVSPEERAAQSSVQSWVCTGSFAGLLVLLGGVFGVGTLAFGRDRYAAPSGPFELRQVTVAFDWTVRRALQAELMALAQTAGRDAAGRRDASGRVAELLAAACGGARYAAFQTFRLPQRDAQAKQGALALTYRSRFQHELAGVRASGHAPALRARHEEGEGLVVVTLIVGWRGAMPSLPTHMDASAAAAALASMRPAAHTQVVALEVIWSPAAEEDRMSSAELEALYPELVRLDASDRLGRRSCRYCRAVYAAELAGCPACGAPS